MSQLNGNFQPGASSFDRGGTFQPGHLADSVQTPQERPERSQEQEAEETVLPVFPPPLPWPRVFPPL